MKKTIFALAIAAIASVGAFAQSADDNKTNCNPQQCPVAQCDPQCAPQGQCNQPCEFEGLNLTDAQKAQIKEIKQAQRAERQSAKADKQDKKEAKKDARANAKREYLAKVKAVLSPEQYVQYLENLVVKGDNAIKRDFRKGGDRDKGPRGPQQGGPRGQRPDAQAPAN